MYLNTLHYVSWLGSWRTLYKPPPSTGTRVRNFVTHTHIIQSTASGLRDVGLLLPQRRARTRKTSCVYNYSIARTCLFIPTPHSYCQTQNHDSWRPPWGRCSSDLLEKVGILSAPHIMFSSGVMVESREIRLGALSFIVDDSAWLQEAPLDVDALPA